MEEARQLLSLLEAPLLAFLPRVGVFLLILATSLVLARVVRFAVLRGLAGTQVARMGPLIGQAARLVVISVGVAVGLDHLGLDLRALIASAGILGLALSFGAQNTVRDMINGFFLLLDEELAPGDLVQVGDRFGYVEEVNLRITKVRAINGQLWYFPNGEIRTVGNYCRGWINAMLVVGIAYESDLVRAMRVMQEVGEGWAAENPELVLDAPQVQSVFELEDSAVQLRLVVKLQPVGEQWPVERALRHRVKLAFDEAGIHFALPRRIVSERDITATEGSPQDGQLPDDLARGGG